MSLARTIRVKRRIAAAAAVLILGFGAAPCWAQNAVTGRALFENTIATTGLANLTGNCTSCHASVQERRTKIGGSPNAEISLTTATSRVGQAVATVPEMRQFQAFTAAQVQDLGAFIADTPETSTDQLNFTASAVNTPAAEQFVDLKHAKATSETLKVMGVAITGTNAARFTRTSDNCDQQTLQPGGACRVTITYSAPDTSGTIVPLTFTLRQGTSTTDFTRTMFLNGSVAVTAPPPGGGASAIGSDSGGGGLGWRWLAALALASMALLLVRERVPARARLKS